MTDLVTWIWQGLVVVAATSLIVRALPRLNAATRHAIWWLALGMVLLHPWPPSDVPFEPMAGPAAPAAAGPVGFVPPSLPLPPFWFVAAIAGVWAGIAAWRAIQIVLSFRAIAALKRRSTPFDAGREERLPIWRALGRVGRRCELRVSEQAPGPCALGFRRPAILIPRSLADELSDAELDQVIAHEHAHLLRYDDWLHLVQCGITALLGVHPAIWLIGRHLDLEREAACDDRVVAWTGSPRAYASCLARVAALLVEHQQQRTLAIAPAVAGSSAVLRTRVERLLHRGWNRTLCVRRLPAAIALGVLGVVVVACDQAPPLVMFRDAAGSAARPAASMLIPPVHAAPRVVSVPPPSSEPESAVKTPRRRTAGRPQVAQVRTPLRIDASAMLPSIATAPPENSTGPGVVVSDLQTPTLVGASAPAPEPPVAALAQTSKESPGTWSNVGTAMAHAGVSVGRNFQQAGKSVGRWFTRAPRTDRPAPQR